jgi:hypothetical protein
MDEAEEIYRNFCEDGHANEPLDQAWNEYEQFNGEIQSDSLVEKLIVAAMKYAIAHRIED